LQRSENPGWRGVPLYARRGGLARWDAAYGVVAAQGDSSECCVIPHSHLVRLGDLQGALQLLPGSLERTGYHVWEFGELVALID